MKLGLFIPALIGFLFVNSTLEFTLNGGISRKTNPLTGINSFSIDGTLGANDIVKAIILSGAVALISETSYGAAQEMYAPTFKFFSVMYLIANCVPID